MSEDRFTQFETLLTQLQYDMDCLNLAILGQQQRIDQLVSELTHVRGVLTATQEDHERRDPKEEKPPHY